MTMPPTPPQGGSPGWPQDQPPSPDSFFNRRRWVIIGLSMVVVVAVVLGLTVWKASSQRLGGPGSTSDGDVDRTVGLLREKDPVCDEWGKYADELAAKEEQWAGTDDSVPAQRWTVEQRQIFVELGAAIRAAASQFEAILPAARNVVIQELIAQTIIYQQEYVQNLSSYVGNDALIAGVARNFSNAVTFMCAAVPWVPAEGSDYVGWSSTVPNPAMLSDFMTKRDSICSEFVALLDRQGSMLEGWTAGVSTVPADRWGVEERALNRGVREVLTHDLRQFHDIAERAKGRVVGDLLATHNAYLQVFVDAIPTYTPDDIKMWRVVIALAGGISAACEART